MDRWKLSTERAAPLAAALAALTTLACCLPLGIASAAGVFGLGIVLDSARPWLMGLSVLLLAVGLVQFYRSGRQCRRRSRAGTILFMLSTAIVVLVIVFPQQLAGLMALVP